MPTDLEQSTIDLEDQRTEDDSAEIEPFRYSISSYGADYPVDSLVKRMHEGAIYVPPFQREFVWDIKDASRFIESLLLGLPVPSIFLSREPDTGKLLVVDGQQRLLSLRYFYDGIWEPTKKEFALKGVQPEFAGKTYKTLRDEDRRGKGSMTRSCMPRSSSKMNLLKTKVVSTSLRASNSGGKRLTPQKIRNAVHHIRVKFATSLRS